MRYFWLAFSLGSVVLAQLFERADASMSERVAVLSGSTHRHHEYEMVRPPAAPTSRQINSIDGAATFFISQYRGPFNPQASDGNANCGPASLAMVLKRFFIDSPLVAESEPEKLVQLARLAMTDDTDDDVNTDNDDVVRGAAALGLPALRTLDLSSIDRALDAGAAGIVSGSPSCPGSFGDRLAYRHCRHGHFIVIAGRSGGQYIMNDPESPDGAHEISRRELDGFISYWPPEARSLHGGIALFAPSRPASPRLADLERRLQWE